MAAPRSRRGEDQLSGAQRASVIMMSIDEEVAGKIFAMMTEDEIKEISQTMSALGTVNPDMVESLMNEFSEEMGHGSNLIGDLSTTQKILRKALTAEQVDQIMEDITGPAGSNTWEKLNHVGEEILAAYIKNEYPQTAALILSRVRSSQAARVLSILPEEFALEILQRMISMEPVKQEVLVDVEQTLMSEFMTTLGAKKEENTYENIAEIFNNFDRSTETKFLEKLDEAEPESAERIRELMFTFDDLIKLDGTSIQALLRSADKEKLPVALKGANEQIRELFFGNMSERASKILKEDMESKGPVRIRDVDEAQTSIVNTAKTLAESGEIVIPEGDEDDEEMIY